MATDTSEMRRVSTKRRPEDAFGEFPIVDEIDAQIARMFQSDEDAVINLNNSAQSYSYSSHPYAPPPSHSPRRPSPSRRLPSELAMAFNGGSSNKRLSPPTVSPLPTKQPSPRGTELQRTSGRGQGQSPSGGEKRQRLLPLEDHVTLSTADRSSNYVEAEVPPHAPVAMLASTTNKQNVTSRKPSFLVAVNIDDVDPADGSLPPVVTSHVPPPVRRDSLPRLILEPVVSERAIRKTSHDAGVLLVIEPPTPNAPRPQGPPTDHWPELTETDETRRSSWPKTQRKPNSKSNKDYGKVALQPSVVEPRQENADDTACQQQLLLLKSKLLQRSLRHDAAADQHHLPSTSLAQASSFNSTAAMAAGQDSALPSPRFASGTVDHRLSAADEQLRSRSTKNDVHGQYYQSDLPSILLPQGQGYREVKWREKDYVIGLNMNSPRHQPTRIPIPRRLKPLH